MPLFLLCNKECDWPLSLGSWEGILHLENFLTAVSLFFMNPSDHTWVYAMRWKDSGWRTLIRISTTWLEYWGFKTGRPPGRGKKRKKRGNHGLQGVEDWVQWGNNDSINHTYGKEAPKKNLWIPKLSGVSCLTNTSMCWEDVTHWFHGEVADLCIWNPSRPYSVSSFSWA